MSAIVPAPRPHLSPWLVQCFGLYTRRYLRRHFHALRVSAEGRAGHFGGEPLIVYLNHAAWWDPLVCLFLQQTLFPERSGYAPIAASALERYPLFSRLGFFGVEQGTRRGAVQFLTTAQQVLERPRSVLWITPQGRFQDVRARPVVLQGGLGHLAARLGRGWVLPLAIEYPFWEERLPEVLLRFGQPVELGRLDGIRGGAGWTSRLERRLEETQDELAVESRERNPAQFRVLLGGQAGVGAIYDVWRRLRALATGKRFSPQHGNL